MTKKQRLVFTFDLLTPALAHMLDKAVELERIATVTGNPSRASVARNAIAEYYRNRAIVAVSNRKT